MTNGSGESGNNGRLRWWQEEKPTTRPSEPRWYTTPPVVNEEIEAVSVAPGQRQAVLPEPLDIGDELEAEARRRMELVQDAVVIEGNVDQIYKRKVSLIRWILIPYMVMMLFGAVLGHDPSALIPFFMLLAELIFLPIWMKKIWRRSPPSLTISSLGLNIQMPFYRVGPIFWSEIKSVRARRMLFVRYLQIDLKDKKAVYRRAFRATGKDNWISRMNAWMYQFMPLQLDDSFFPVSADVMAAKIAAFTRGQSDVK